MRRFATGLLFAVAAYILGAVGGGFLVSVLSSNTHDRSLEAAMTGAFFIGPVAGILGFIVGIARSKARTGGPTGERESFDSSPDDRAEPDR